MIKSESEEILDALVEISETVVKDKNDSKNKPKDELARLILQYINKVDELRTRQMQRKEVRFELELSKLSNLRNLFENNLQRISVKVTTRSSSISISQLLDDFEYSGEDIIDNLAENKIIKEKLNKATQKLKDIKEDSCPYGSNFFLAWAILCDLKVSTGMLFVYCYPNPNRIFFNAGIVIRNEVLDIIINLYKCIIHFDEDKKISIDSSDEFNDYTLRFKKLLDAAIKREILDFGKYYNGLKDFRVQVNIFLTQKPVKKGFSQLKVSQTLADLETKGKNLWDNETSKPKTSNLHKVMENLKNDIKNYPFKEDGYICIWEILCLLSIYVGFLSLVEIVNTAAEVIIDLEKQIVPRAYIETVSKFISIITFSSKESKGEKIKEILNELTELEVMLKENDLKLKEILAKLDILKTNCQNYLTTQIDPKKALPVEISAELDKFDEFGRLCVKSSNLATIDKEMRGKILTQLEKLSYLSKSCPYGKDNIKPWQLLCDYCACYGLLSTLIFIDRTQPSSESMPAWTAV